MNAPSRHLPLDNVRRCATSALRVTATLAFLVLSVAEVRAATVTMTWDRNPEPDVVGYVISYGTQSGSYSTTVDVGNVTTWVVSLAGGQRYYFAAQAYNTSGLRSGMSVEVFADVAASAGPSIASLSPSSGATGTVVTISGANFGATQGTSSVRFNGTTATPGNWSASSIVVPVPTGATTGNVVVTVGGAASNGLPFTVNAVNNPPTLSAITNQNNPENTTVSLPLVASDPDGNSVTYTATPLPAGLSINSSTGLISGTLTFTSAGTYTVTVTVSDGSLTASGTFTWTVTNVNATPLLTNPGSQTSVISAPVSLQLVGTDAGNDTLSFSATGLPPGLSVNSVTGLISGTAPSTTGSYSIMATVSDGTLSSSQSFTWTVIVQSIAFVQVTSAAPQGFQPTVAATFQAAQTAGNLNVVIVGWDDATRTVQSVTDTAGNGYVPAIGPTVSSNVSQQIYYAKNIAAAAAGANSVTVTFVGGSAYFPDLRIAEYSGIDLINPLDVVHGASGATATTDSGSVTTTNANDLLVAGNILWGEVTTSAGTGFTSRLVTTQGDIIEDRVVTSVGSYSATAPVNGTNAWVMQMVAFRAAGGAAPPALTSLSPSSGPIGALVTIAGANFGATQGSSTVTFNGMTAMPSSWSATGIVVSVPAGATTGNVVITANNLASNGVNFTVKDTQAPTAPGTPTTTVVSSSRIDLAWTAAMDNVGVSNYLIERCQGAGCTAFAQIATSSIAAFSDTGLTASTSYAYRVRATDTANNLSAYSSVASATTQAASTAPITFVQANYAALQAAQTTVTVPFVSTQRAGDVNLIVVGWNDSIRQVQAVTDAQGNAYVLAVGPTVYAGVASQATYYAPNIAGAAAGANAVTVVFTSAATSPSVRIAEYSGVDPAHPVDVTIAAQGASGSSNTGSMTTTRAGLLVAANLVQTGTAAGTGFTLRPAAGTPGIVYVRDSFTAADGTALGTHTPELGGAWIDDQPGMVMQGNKVESPNFADGRSHNAVTPASANYDVQVDVTLAVPGWGNKAGVRGRDEGGRLGDAYEASFNESTHTWTLDKWKHYNVTTLGTYADPGFTSGTKTLKLRMVGSSIQVFVNGTLRISVTDSTIKAANHPGLRGSGGVHNGLPLSNYVVQDVSNVGITPFLLEDRAASTAGTYSATASVSPAGAWIIQMILLR